MDWRPSQYKDVLPVSIGTPPIINIRHSCDHLNFIMEIPIHEKIFIILRRNPFYQWLFQEYFEENMSKFVISIVTSDVEMSLTARIFILLYLYYYIHTVMTVQHVKGLRVHCGKNRMATILQVTFSDTLPGMKIFYFLFLLTIYHHHQFR